MVGRVSSIVGGLALALFGGVSVLLGILGGLVLLTPALAITEPSSESVILLHGLGRGPWGMKVLEQRLGDAGFEVHNLTYPRRADSIDEIVTALHEQYGECCSEKEGRVHFVTHSLGGLVARAYLAEHPPANLGRVVMLAPPNGGSEIVDSLRDWSMFGAVLGPMAPQLGTRAQDLPARLPVPPTDVGVIAGDRWFNPVGPFLLPAPHDGTVSVASTRLPGMKDHLVVPHTHTFIMNAKVVSAEIVHFLRHGRFQHRDFKGPTTQRSTSSPSAR